MYDLHVVVVPTQLRWAVDELWLVQEHKWLLQQETHDCNTYNSENSSKKKEKVSFMLALHAHTAMHDSVTNY